MSGEVIRVPADHATIQAAIDAASQWDEIWVAEGRHLESITLKSGVKLYGGFAGTETHRDERDFRIRPTIIDASTADEGEPAAIVVIMNGTTDTRIDGFTITGVGGLHSSNIGCGIFCEDVDESNMIINCTVSSNRGGVREGTRGGGLFIENGTPTLINCTITDNLANLGGGIYGGSPTLINCRITGNLAYGILCRCAPTQWCVKPGNGGGIYRGQSPTLVNCIVSGNISNGAAAGIDAEAPRVINCTIYDNSGVGITGSNGEIHNSIIWAHTEDVDPLQTATYSCIENWTGGGEGNISDDPRFVDPENGDFHLLPDSPCIDAGGFVESLDDDFEGDPRPLDAIVLFRGDGSDFDIGADEYLPDNRVPMIWVLAPNRIRTWTLGSSHPVRWLADVETLGTAYNVELVSEEDGSAHELGVFWEERVDSVEERTATITVPSTMPEGGYRIRVTSNWTVQNPELFPTPIFDDSDEPIRISVQQNAIEARIWTAYH